MAFHSMQNILEFCTQKNIDFYQAILDDDCKERGVSQEESQNDMLKMWDAMLQASNDYDSALMSKSGLVGGNGAKMSEYIMSADGGCSGQFVCEVISEALKMGESNACMKRIVAAPTAGSSGVLPAVLIPYYKNHNNSTNEITSALYVAAGIGQIIAEKAYISGAAGGCQAEIGSASAMAAGALVYIKNGTDEQICEAVAMSLKNLLGLICDPVAGLVEVPCVKRNVIGAVNALASADMALAGIKSAIPVDQVIDAMREVGDNMPSQYKETAGGGCAVTPLAKTVQDKFEALG